MSRVLHRIGSPRGATRIAALVAAATFAGLFATGPSGAWANNDPHRVFLPSSPFDIDSNVCGFPVHVDIPIDRQYGTFSTAQDGSTILKITGSLVWTLTNETNGNTITLNVSGPGVITFPIDTTLAVVNAQGLNIIYITNGSDFGVPNLFYSSGLLQFTTDLSNDTITDMPTRPHVLLDVCTALS
jgi:hypothetical protein